MNRSENTATSLYVEEGGSGADLLVLLHGLGATGAVWTPLLEYLDTRWSGRWFAPDLPGHGQSARASRYYAEDAAAVIGGLLKSRARPDGRLVILGHSFGGTIALALASGRYGVQPSVVFGVGIKLVWRDEEIARMRAFASQPAKRFANEADAWERYLKVSGLFGLTTPGSLIAARGVSREGDAWRLAMDAAANDAGRPAFAELRAAARCRVHLARGGRDPLVTLEDTRALDPEAVDLGTYGHNVLVESPETVWAWVAAQIHHSWRR
jgi:pimeloyl-ACP methyl ester carboxylesterase